MNKILRNSIVAAMVLGTVGTSSFYNYTYAYGKRYVDGNIAIDQYLTNAANATGHDAIAVGANSNVNAESGMAVGCSAKVSGDWGLAVGTHANAKGEYGVAVGMYALAEGENSIALGRYSTAKNENEFSVGADKGDFSWVDKEVYRRITHVADGTGDHDAVTLSQAKALVSAGLDQKMDKSALDGYAKTTDLATKANTSDLNAYAKADATNITGESLTKWQSTLGNGTITENNSGLVTGGKVFDAIKDKADKSTLSDYAKTTALTELETKVTNITNGTTQVDGSKINLATNNTFTTLQSTVNGKANADATNITGESLTKWQSALGNGTIAENNSGLVTGGTVYTALSAYAKASALSELETKVTNITNGTTKIDVTNIDLATNNTFKTLQSTVEGKANASDLNAYAKADGSNVTTPATWATKLGTGEVATGNANLVTGGKVFDAIKDKADKSTLSDYAKATDLTALKTQVTNITNGTTQVDGSKINLATNNTFTTLQNTVNGKANADATNITGESLTKWQSALGNGTITENNSGLVTGGTVYTALSAYAKATDLTTLKTQVTNITNGTTKIDVKNIDLATNDTFTTLQGTVNGKANINADNITVSDWATKLGTGTVAENNNGLVTGGTVFNAIKDKADKSALSDYAKASDLTTLKTQVTNITSGATEVDGSKINLATNTTFTALQSTVNGKANTNADNITVSDWATKLGTGEVATGNANLVTGGKVFDAIKDKADKSTLSDYAKATDLTALKTQVTNITNGTTKIDVTNIDLATNNTFKTLKTSVEGKANTNADNITVSDWATKLGTGEVVTGNANLVTGGKVFDAIKDKADKSTLSDYAKATDLTALKTQVTNITNGTTKIDVTNIDLATNNTFKTLQNTVNGKANTNADNITVSDWATKLGTGKVESGNTNLVTGGTVYTALSAYAKSADLTKLEKQVTDITNGTTQVMTFMGTNGITATVSNNKITLGMNWEDASAPKFHIYQDQGESSAEGGRRRARSVGDTSNIPGTTSISSMDFGHLNMVFGKGLKAEKKEKNGTTYTLISLTENTGMSKFTVKTDEKDKTKQKEETFDVDGSKAQLNVVGDGKNISTSIDKDNNTVKVSLKDDVSINSLTAKTVTTDTVKVNDKVYLDKDGLHANDQVISDVKAGEKDSDAVNVAQLKALAGHTDKMGRAVGKLAVESRNGDALNAALSALRPLDYDPESKFDVSAGYGTYKGVHAVAVGTFYRPNATTLFSIGGSFTGGDSMMNAGVSFKVGSGSGSQTYLSRQAIASMLKRFSVEHEAMKNVLAEQDARIQAQIEALQKENSSLKDKVNRLEKENNDRIEKANNRIAELERQVKEVLINLKK